MERACPMDSEMSSPYFRREIIAPCAHIDRQVCAAMVQNIKPLLLPPVGP
jgi:hypothetical protein